MKPLLLTALLFTAKAGFAQKTYVGIDPIAAAEVAPWAVQRPTNYAGTYHFGYSEWESEFELKVVSGLVIAVERRYPIPASGSARPIPPTVKRFTHARIVGRRFYSDQLNGEFVSFDDEGKQCYGLKVYPSWNFKGQKAAEIGVRVQQ